MSALVVKVGGHALDDLGPTSSVLGDLAEDLQGLERVVVVHGGGPQIADLLRRLDLESHFHQGLRVTDDPTMEVVSMALAQVNALVVARLVALGRPALGLSGLSAGLLTSPVDSGFLGRIAPSVRVRTALLEDLLRSQWIPVISPVSLGDDGGLLNCNADTAAGALAGALDAGTLIMLSDIDQVRADPDDPSSALESLTRRDLDELIASGAARDGMRPKLAAALAALDAGARRVVLANGTRPHAVRGALEHSIPTTEVLP
ncbi:MAG: acetylglutamate kinase [Acidimicrobiaceae bacterium]|nr:acetylglutamate kinase [Acidimicrobiaceae bacterium]